ncbi:MAG: hypothetical protein PHS59_16995 [Paludibacter sp.]|nr:hypothetical protein [Paludibacter sp.]
MNKKQISVALAVLMFFNTTALIAVDKKDISDPVLRQIISELGSKMPRFVDKYGDNVFVADEQITRGSLITALYEYDKKMSLSGSGSISKKELDLLNTRLTALEKNTSPKGLGAPRTAAVDVDIIKVMNDLEPNMPMLLDNSLENSKVFKALQEKVEMAGPVTASSSASLATSKTSSLALTNIQKDIANLNKKVDDFELSLSSAKTGSSKLTDTQVSASISNMQKDILNLNKKIDDFGLSLASAKTGSSKLTDTQVSANISNIQKEIANVNNRISLVENSLTSKDISSSGPVSSQESLRELTDLRRSLIQMQKSYVAVSKRVDELENKPVVYAGKEVDSSQINLLNSKINSIKETVSDIPTSASVQDQISKSNSQTASNIKQLENRLNNLEKTGVSGDSSKSSSTSTVAKISLGLTMIAALFIAR